MSERLEIVRLRKAYGGRDVLSGIDLSVSQGETVAIIGRSGIGKSTLLRCITLLEKPDEGTLTLDGQDYFRKSFALYEPWEVRRKIGLVFQDFKLFPNMTALQNIIFPLRKVKALRRGEAERRSVRIMEDLGISDVGAKYPNELSGGQAQRCALARAIVLEPEVLLLDEITSALDPATIGDVTSTLRGLRGVHGGKDLSIILVTHLMHFAESFADRIAFLGDGVVLDEGPAKAFFETTECDEVRRFVSPLREII